MHEEYLDETSSVVEFPAPLEPPEPEDFESLERDPDRDYTLKPEAMSVWITVDNISVYIKRNDDNVAVALYARQREDEDALAETYLPYREAEESLEVEE